MHTLARIIGSTAITAAAIALTACGGGNNSATSSAVTSSALPSTMPGAGAPPAAPSHGRVCTADDIKTTGGFGQAPTITIPDNCDPPTRLVTEDLVPGSGPGAVNGQHLTMNYTLVTWSDHKKLDSSFDRNEPFELTLGAGQVIPGWDQGLAGIKQGGRRLLIIPPQLGYGEGGNGIKPNETLVFVTDAVKIGN